jgi:hypothetical protein
VAVRVAAAGATAPTKVAAPVTRPKAPTKASGSAAKPRVPVKTSAPAAKPRVSVKTSAPAAKPKVAVKGPASAAKPKVQAKVSAPAPKPTVPVKAPAPTVKPTLKLTASASAVRRGERVTLSWSGQGVSNCQASGSWSGQRSSSGSMATGALTERQSYTLACDSAEGRIMAMTSVQVSSGGTRIAWVAPRYSVDGKALNDLAAYRIYVGTVSRDYFDQIDLTDVSATQHILDLEPGTYYIAMTAIDADGNESNLSNELKRVVN